MVGRYFFALAATCLSVLAQEDADLADFGQTVLVNGDMVRTDQDFKDGLAVDLFSATPRSLVVSKKQPPSLPCSFVTGTTGGPFVCLSEYSWVIKFNETVNDLIGGKIELPYDPVALAKAGVSDDNTYVGRLAADGKGWMVIDGDRNVHRTENKTRALKMNSLDGEWMILGRKLADSSNVLVQYAFGATRTMNITGGDGRQEAEFIDGLKVSVISKTEMKLNIDVPTVSNAGVGSAPKGWEYLNPYAWVVNTSNPSAPVEAAMSIPVNQLLLRSKLGRQTGCAQVALGVSGSGNVSVVGRAQTIPLDFQFGRSQESPQDVFLGMSNDDFRITVDKLTRLDGKYVLTYNPNSPTECGSICNADSGSSGATSPMSSTSSPQITFANAGTERRSLLLRKSTYSAILFCIGFLLY